MALEIEQADGELVKRLTWGENESTEGIMVQVGRIVERSTGEKHVNVQGIFNCLADLLKSATLIPNDARQFNSAHHSGL